VNDDPFHSAQNLKRGGSQTQYKPGKSGNPRGPSAVRFELARRIREQTGYGQLLIDYAKACVMGKKKIASEDGEVIKIPQDPKSRAYCHAWLSERGWGRPKQELVIEEKSAEGARDVRSMSLDELRKLATGEPGGSDGDGGGVH
jgi:hypothetical protein